MPSKITNTLKIFAAVTVMSVVTVSSLILTANTNEKDVYKRAKGTVRHVITVDSKRDANLYNVKAVISYTVGSCEFSIICPVGWVTDKERCEIVNKTPVIVHGVKNPQDAYVVESSLLK